MAEKFCHSLPCKRSVRPLRGGRWDPRRHRDSQRGPDLLLCHLLLRRAPPPDPHSARDPISGPSPLSSQPMVCTHSRAAREVNTQTQLRTTPERARRAVVRFRKPRRWPLAIGHNHYCFYPKSNQFDTTTIVFTQRTTNLASSHLPFGQLGSASRQLDGLPRCLWCS